MVKREGKTRTSTRMRGKDKSLIVVDIVLALVLGLWW
jgi:hypothetical protein